MAKVKAKKGTKMNAVQTEKAARPVRLDLSESDHQRLERLARERGLNKASYARQAVLERMKADEAGSK
jgi:very-short-patch-repair endonuclease